MVAGLTVTLLLVSDISKLNILFELKFQPGSRTVCRIVTSCDCISTRCKYLGHKRHRRLVTYSRLNWKGKKRADKIKDRNQTSTHRINDLWINDLVAITFYESGTRSFKPSILTLTCKKGRGLLGTFVFQGWPGNFYPLF